MVNEKYAREKARIEALRKDPVAYEKYLERQRAKARKYRAAHREEVNARRRRWIAAHPERRLAYRLLDEERHGEQIRARKAEYNRRPETRRMRNEYQRKYWRQRRAEDPDGLRAQSNERAKRARWKLRFLVIDHYTNGKRRCQNPACLVPGGCGDIRTLQIDHLNGGGTAHARSIQKESSDGYSESMTRWIVRHGFPPEFQILCANCNWIKRHERREFSTRGRPRSSPP